MKRSHPPPTRRVSGYCRPRAPSHHLRKRSLTKVGIFTRRATCCRRRHEIAYASFHLALSVSRALRNPTLASSMVARPGRAVPAFQTRQKALPVFLCPRSRHNVVPCAVVSLAVKGSQCDFLPFHTSTATTVSSFGAAAAPKRM